MIPSPIQYVATLGLGAEEGTDVQSKHFHMVEASGDDLANRLTNDPVSFDVSELKGWGRKNILSMFAWVRNFFLPSIIIFLENVCVCMCVGGREGESKNVRCYSPR
jgi:hypothetical protein